MSSGKPPRMPRITKTNKQKFATILYSLQHQGLTADGRTVLKADLMAFVLEVLGTPSTS